MYLLVGRPEWLRRPQPVRPGISSNCAAVAQRYRRCIRVLPRELEVHSCNFVLFSWPYFGDWCIFIETRMQHLIHLLAKSCSCSRVGAFLLVPFDASKYMDPNSCKSSHILLRTRALGHPESALSPNPGRTYLDPNPGFFCHKSIHDTLGVQVSLDHGDWMTELRITNYLE